MAKATKIPVPTPQFKYILELTSEEAQAITDITSKIGGTASGSPRGHIDAIARALMSIGFTTNYDAAYGNITFKEKL